MNKFPKSVVLDALKNTSTYDEALNYIMNVKPFASPDKISEGQLELD